MMKSAEAQSPDLKGLRVLVTRPRQQAAGFVKKLTDAGAKTFELPGIEINYHDQQTIAAKQTEQSQHSDLWIFTSANAVTGADRCGVLPLTAGDQNRSAPKIAAIGQATLRCLEAHSISVDFVPPVNSGSEEFIARFKAQINKGDKITIVRGDSGREVLKKQLQTLGADVHYLEAYRRQLPSMTASDAIKIFVEAQPCVVSITSDLVLTNLLHLLPTSVHATFFNCPLVVNSERCALLAKNLGFHQQILTASPPGDQGQMLAISRLLQTTSPPLS